MQVRKVLNIEDSASKHVAVVRALERCGITNIDSAITAEEGLAMIEDAIEEGWPYHLIVSDMFFPMFSGGGEEESGIYVMKELQERGIDVPVIICSSARYMGLEYEYDVCVGSIHYNPRNDLDADMREMLDIVRN